MPSPPPRDTHKRAPAAHPGRRGRDRAEPVGQPRRVRVPPPRTLRHHTLAKPRGGWARHCVCVCVCMCVFACVIASASHARPTPRCVSCSFAMLHLSVLHVLSTTALAHLPWHTYRSHIAMALTSALLPSTYLPHVEHIHTHSVTRSLARSLTH